MTLNQGSPIVTNVWWNMWEAGIGHRANELANNDYKVGRVFYLICVISSIIRQFVLWKDRTIESTAARVLTNDQNKCESDLLSETFPSS